MAAYITVGAKTTHGGEVITGSPYTTHNGVQVSRKGDKVLCKKCKKVTTILTGDPSFIVDGALIAREGDITSCGAKLIAIQQSFAESDFEVFGVEQPAPIFEQPAPLQFHKSDPEALFNQIREDNLYDDRFQLLDQHSQLPLAYINYRLDYDGKSVEGKTDAEGFTEIIESNYSAAVDIYLLIDEDE
ncbi:PAAR domain-containing protein [uncultured Psychrobacter sp.]|uniref:PAAR domain-containing protein n=1 Tax=uncultured Psychrobacter sp. TaxID=259303 RepID=UPI003459F977